MIISDVDIAITYKNWDDEIIKILDSGYSCFGAKNIRKEREPLNFPNIPFFCFRKDIISMIDLDFTPVMDGNKIKKYIIEDEVEAKFTNVDRKNRTVALSIKAKEVHEEAEALSSYKSETAASSSGTTLGELLKEKLSGGTK